MVEYDLIEWNSHAPETSLVEAEPVPLVRPVADEQHVTMAALDLLDGAVGDGGFMVGNARQVRHAGVRSERRSDERRAKSDKGFHVRSPRFVGSRCHKAREPVLN